MRSKAAIFRLFRIHQLVMMAGAWLIYAMPIAGMAYLLIVPGDEWNSSFANGIVPVTTRILMALYGLILLASVVLVPLWILHYCEEPRDWFAFALWIMLSWFFVGWASMLVILPGIFAITGGQFWDHCCVDHF